MADKHAAWLVAASPASVTATHRLTSAASSLFEVSSTWVVPVIATPAVEDVKLKVSLASMSIVGAVTSKLPDVADINMSVPASTSTRACTDLISTPAVPERVAWPSASMVSVVTACTLTSPAVDSKSIESAVTVASVSALISTLPAVDDRVTPSAPSIYTPIQALPVGDSGVPTHVL